jgi:hypothetical protein
MLGRELGSSGYIQQVQVMYQQIGQHPALQADLSAGRRSDVQGLVSAGIGRDVKEAFLVGNPVGQCRCGDPVHDASRRGGLRASNDPHGVLIEFELVPEGCARGENNAKGIAHGMLPIEAHHLAVLVAGLRVDSHALYDEGDNDPLEFRSGTAERIGIGQIGYRTRRIETQLGRVVFDHDRGNGSARTKTGCAAVNFDDVARIHDEGTAAEPQPLHVGDEALARDREEEPVEPRWSPQNRNPAAAGTNHPRPCSPP